jgi:hypothetical protein
LIRSGFAVGMGPYRPIYPSTRVDSAFCRRDSATTRDQRLVAVKRVKKKW